MASIPAAMPPNCPLNRPSAHGGGLHPELEALGRWSGPRDGAPEEDHGGAHGRRTLLAELVGGGRGRHAQVEVEGSMREDAGGGARWKKYREEQAGRREGLG